MKEKDTIKTEFCKDKDIDVISNNLTKKENYKYGEIVLKYYALPSKYTLEEIKKMSAKSDCAYVAGYINDTPVAIIGLPKDTNQEYIDVRFQSKMNMMYIFFGIVEEAANNVEFIVYPYSNSLFVDKKMKKSNNLHLQANNDTLEKEPILSLKK